MICSDATYGTGILGDERRHVVVFPLKKLSLLLVSFGRNPCWDMSIRLLIHADCVLSALNSFPFPP
jgi:hypothetical protein